MKAISWILSSLAFDIFLPQNIMIQWIYLNFNSLPAKKNPSMMALLNIMVNNEMYVRRSSLVSLSGILLVEINFYPFRCWFNTFAQPTWVWMDKLASEKEDNLMSKLLDRRCILLAVSLLNQQQAMIAVLELCDFEGMVYKYAQRQVCKCFPEW